MSLDAPAPADAKPALRGWVHAAGVVALGASSPALFARCHGPAQVGWVSCFVAGVGLMMGVSALYHRVARSERARRAWRVADLTAIFCAIAGTGVAIAGLTLDPRDRLALVGAVAAAALAGLVLVRVMARPRWTAATYFLVVGWAAALFTPAISRGGGGACAALVVAGGLSYSVGAVVYAARRPRLSPRVFGFHELFHACTLVAVGCHFAAIYLALR
ncbi:MAG: PAQR family membrane homeostasis protein TrhA [Acidimicrobiales bacterium]